MNRIALALLLFPLVLLSACRGAEVKFPAGTHVFKVGETLKAELTELRSTRKKLMTWVVLENLGAEEIRFKKSSVSLNYKGRRYPARDFRHYEMDVDVPPGAISDKYWAFHIDELALPGTYDLQVTGINTMKNGQLTPVGEDLLIKVAVPATEGGG